MWQVIATMATHNTTVRIFQDAHEPANEKNSTTVIHRNAKQRKTSNFNCTIWPNEDEIGKNKTWVFQQQGQLDNLEFYFKKFQVVWEMFLVL